MHTPGMALRACAIFFSISAPAAASGLDCVPLEQINSQIRFCTENTIAADQAQACAQRMSQAWDDAARELKQLQASQRKGQRVDFHSSGSKYQSSLRRMASLTRTMMRNADLLASYPSAMAEMNPETSLAESLPCYRENFDRIQSVVLDLDRKSHEAIAAVAAAEALHKTVLARAGAIESETDSDRKLLLGGFEAERAPAAARKKIKKASTISGELKEKRIE